MSNEWTSIYPSVRTCESKNMYTDRRQTDRQADRLTDRQAYKRTDGQTETHTERLTHTDGNQYTIKFVCKGGGIKISNPLLS